MIEFLPLLTAGLGAMSALSSAQAMKEAGKQTQAERAQLQAMANRDRLLQAYLNPDDTIQKNLRASEGRYLNDVTQRGLANLLAANRKARLMGRQTFFNPERQDEDVSQFLTKQSDLNAQTSRSNALQRIMDAVTGYSGSANNYGSMVANQQARQAANANARPAMFGAGADILRMFGGGGGGGSMANIFSMLGGGGGGSVSGLLSPAGGYGGMLPNDAAVLRGAF